VLEDNQLEGDDFHKTFSLVAKMAMVQCLLSLVALKWWELHQMDVHNVFLHGHLDKEIDIKSPPSFIHHSLILCASLENPYMPCMYRHLVKGISNWHQLYKYMAFGNHHWITLCLSIIEIIFF